MASDGSTWRRVLAGAIGAGAAIVFVGTLVILRTDRRIRPGDVQVISRLDEYTRGANPKINNTLPGFLAQHGEVGALSDTGAVSPVAESELLKGFCTATLSRLVRQEYPGTYDDFSDGDLEKRVLETHPDYKDRVCVLPAWVPPAHDIVKYELAPRRDWGMSSEGLAWAIVAAALFGAAALSGYRRVFPEAEPAADRPATSRA